MGDLEVWQFDFRICTGFEGRLVKLSDTIRSFKEILEGKHDGLPEAAFYMVGDIDDAIKKAIDLAKEMSDADGK